MSVAYDNLPINFQQLLSAPFREATGGAGDPTQDVARPHHPLILRGATIAWGQVALSNLTYINLDSDTPDFIECAAADSVDLDFIGDDFAMMCWVHSTGLVGGRAIMYKGLQDNDGWGWFVRATGQQYFETNQLGAGLHQATQSPAGDVVIDTWWLLGMSRSGAAIQLFKNGIGVTDPDETGVHINPASAVARDLHIGIADNEALYPWRGYKWNPRIWGRHLPLNAHKQVFDLEGHFFGW